MFLYWDFKSVSIFEISLGFVWYEKIDFFQFNDFFYFRLFWTIHTNVSKMLYARYKCSDFAPQKAKSDWKKNLEVSVHKVISAQSYQCTKFLAHKVISAQSYQHTKLSVHKVNSAQSYQRTKLSVHKVISSQSYQCTKLSAHKVISAQSYQFTKLSVHKFISAQSYQCTNLSADKVISAQSYQCPKFDIIRRWYSHVNALWVNSWRNNNMER